MPDNSENDLASRALQGRIDRARRKRKRFAIILILKFYSILGAFSAVFGLVYAIFQAFDINMSPEVTMGILVSASGGFLSAVSIVTAKYILARDASMEELEGDEISQVLLLRQWAEFERSVQSALGLEPNSPKSFSIRSMLNELRDSNIISDEDFTTVRAALEMRNKVAHGSAVDSSLEELELISKALGKISRKIEKRKAEEVVPD